MTYDGNVDEEIYLDMVFEGMPGPNKECVFVDAEIDGMSVNVGKWIERPDGRAALRLTNDVEDPWPEAEEIAKRFHELYEDLAPNFGYKAREASAVPWEKVPDQNKQLMVEVAKRLRVELMTGVRFVPNNPRDVTNNGS